MMLPNEEKDTMRCRHSIHKKHYDSELDRIAIEKQLVHSIVNDLPHSALIDFFNIKWTKDDVHTQITSDDCMMVIESSILIPKKQ